MPFVETEASVRYETINGKRVPVITPKTEVTLTNTVTGQEYMSCLLYTSPSPRDKRQSRMPSSA